MRPLRVTHSADEQEPDLPLRLLLIVVIVSRRRRLSRRIWLEAGGQEASARPAGHGKQTKDYQRQDVPSALRGRLVNNMGASRDA
jgi:hypothetical protein